MLERRRRECDRVLVRVSENVYLKDEKVNEIS